MDDLRADFEDIDILSVLRYIQSGLFMFFHNWGTSIFPDSPTLTVAPKVSPGALYDVVHPANAAGIFPHIIVWGSCFLDCDFRPPPPPPLRRLASAQTHTHTHTHTLT